MRFIFLILAALLLVGCATPARQTEALLLHKPDIPDSYEVPGVPFVNQTAGYCGPATLTMVMQWAGKKVSIDELAPQVYTPGMKGSLQSDLISASRRHGLMAIPIEGLPDLLREVAAGHPVIVFENLALSWLPQWHYAVVFGYDLKNQMIIMHSGPEAFKHWDMSKFERSWMLGDYWGLVVLPPGHLAVSANELSHVTAAAALEQIGKSEEAKTAYLSILHRWPDSLAGLIGLGNLAYAKKDYSTSVKFLRQASKAHPESTAARHNLAVAESALKASVH